MRKNLWFLVAAVALLIPLSPAIAGEEGPSSEVETLESVPADPACPGKSCGGCGMGLTHRGGAGAAPDAPEPAARCCKNCGGGGGGRGAGGAGHGAGKGSMDEDHQVFFFLLDHRDEIRRDVRNIKKGVETVTESDNPEVVEKLREHVMAMYDRLEEGTPIHQRDPLFAEIFEHADEIEMKSESTELGIRVTETSDNPEVAKLIQAHAEVVSQFLVNGHAELRRNHPIP